MIFSYNWLQSFFNKKLPNPEKLAKLFTMHSFEVSEVKKIGGDFVLNIDVLPNRAPDCFSHAGIAREIATLNGLNPHFPAQGLAPNKLRTKDLVTVEVKDKTACSRYTARALSSVKVGTSPKWLQDRLKVCGLNSINNIVDIVNYVMLETGQPLHAFDAEKIADKKLIIRFAKKGEKITTLDGQKFDLNAKVLIIADTKKPLAIAGIKGGNKAEIDKKTKIVILESANFNPQIIRRISKNLNLKTDASLRFEHGLDPNLTEFAITRACHLIQKVTSAKVAQGVVDIYPKKTYPKRIKLNLDYVESLLGVKISLKDIKNILQRSCFKVIGIRSPLLVEVPTTRLDISIPEDLVEEIGRIYGYEKIPSIFPSTILIPARKNEEILWEDMTKDILKEVGFTEVYNYSFIGDKESKILDNKDLIGLENPTSQDQKYLRSSLIPNLLKNVEQNLKYFNQIRIFELGKVFIKNKEEKRHLAGLLLKEDFYQLKGIIDLLLQKLGISDIWYKDSKKNLWHPKKCASINVGNKEIGFLGELSPRILQDLKISNKIVAFDIDFTMLSKFTSEEHEYMPLSRYPSVVRDLAILVPRGIQVVQVLNKINIAGGSLVRDVDLFDIYEGSELPQGKKNLAFHIIYQSEQRTLNSKEVNVLHQKIIKTLEKNLEWQIR